MNVQSHVQSKIIDKNRGVSDVRCEKTFVLITLNWRERHAFKSNIDSVRPWS